MEHKVIQGGEQYLPFARSRIRALRALGLKYTRTQRFVFDDAEVAVKLNGEHDHIWLSGGIPPILSGVIRKGELVDTNPGPLVSNTLRAYKPTEQAWQYPLKSDPDKSPDDFNDEPLLAVKAHDDFGLTESQYEKLSPDLYSGLMAQAVQFLYGLGKKQQVRYDFRWNRTHGIVLATNGKPWLVEISAANGVIAKRLPLMAGSGKYATSVQDVLRETVSLFGGLPSGGGFPKPARLAEAIVSGVVLQLATADDLDAFYSKSAYVSTLGWSFNGTGSEAHNTCYSTDGADYWGHHYKLSITIDPAGASSAELTEVDSGELTIKERSTGFYNLYPFQFYDILTNSVETVPGRLIPAASAEEGPTSAPLFVAHCNGELHVVRGKVTPRFNPDNDIRTVGTPPQAPATDASYTYTVYYGSSGRSIDCPLVEDSIPYALRRRTVYTFVRDLGLSNLTELALGPAIYGCSVYSLNSKTDGSLLVDSRTVGSWPGTARDCYVVHPVSGDYSTVENQLMGYLWRQVPLGPPAECGQVEAESSDPTMILTADQWSVPSRTSLNLAEVPKVPRTYGNDGRNVIGLLNATPITIHEADDPDFATMNAAVGMGVRYSVLGPTQHVAYSQSTLTRYIGPMLEGEPEEAPGLYNFIGYI